MGKTDLQKLKHLLKKKIDYTDHKKLAEDVWLFLTNDKDKERALVNKKAFMHEVKCMLQIVALFTIENYSNILDGLNDEYGCNNVSQIRYDENAGKYYVGFKSGIPADEYDSIQDILDFFKAEDAANN
jgi:hypothetical protein